LQHLSIDGFWLCRIHHGRFLDSLALVFGCLRGICAMSVESANCDRLGLAVSRDLLGPDLLRPSELPGAPESKLPVVNIDATEPAPNRYAGLWQAGRLDELRHQLSTTLEQAEATGNDQELLDATNDLACVYRALGDQISAAEFQTQAAAREVAICGSGNLSPASISNLACDALLAGDWQTAEGLFWKTLLTELSSGNDAGAAADWANLGLLAGLQGDHEESRIRLWEALKLHRRAGDLLGVGMDLWHLGQSFEETGVWPISARLFRRAEQQFASIKNEEMRTEARVRKEFAMQRDQVTKFESARN
jgi:tetratricopeptide (TPR) repeat protein